MMHTIVKNSSKIVFVSLLASTLVACQPNKNESPDASNTLANTEQSVINLEYPVTRKDDTFDTYHGNVVADPYRWLEDDRSEETESWVKQQNTLTQSYFEQIPYIQQISDVVRDVINYERVTAPFKEGKYTYFYKNNGLQNQSIVYRQLGDGEPEVFIDPNQFSDDGTVSLAGLSFSSDGSIAAYQTSTGGSDWREVYFLDTDTLEIVGETLTNVKFSGIEWYKNEGVYYSSYDKPDGSELSAKTDQHKLYYHKVGTSQSKDLKVFGHTAEQKHRYVGAQVSDDSRYLLVSASVSTSGNRAYLMDLDNQQAGFKLVKQNLDSDIYMLTSQGSQLFLVTNQDAPNGKIVTLDAMQADLSSWTDFIPEAEHVLSPSAAGGFIFAEYMVDAISKVYQYTLQGQQVRTITLPGVGSAGSFQGKKEQTTLYYTFSNYTMPSTVYAYDPTTGESSIYNKPESSFKSDEYVSNQVFYESKDGTTVPMIITHHKDTELNGDNPTILYGYGGFNVSLTPRFSSTVAAWLKLGGVYAVPNIRGGGEYGKDWHTAGTKLQKQNVFDDFIAAAEYLIENSYTNSSKLALRGGSNGGLLVAAVTNQRPELAAVSLPAVGVLDMLRYHTFTAGAGWAYDYGTAEDNKEMFEYLKAYSPLHNVPNGANYPATLVTTADHDDRVVPAHSFKFAAQLQASKTGSSPTLIRIETDAGHGAGTPISKTIEQFGDIYGFTLWNMGVREL